MLLNVYLPGAQALEARYPVVNLFGATLGAKHRRHEDPSLTPADHARRVFGPSCAVRDARTAEEPPAAAASSAADESFVSAALRGDTTASARNYARPPTTKGLRERLQAMSAQALSSVQPPGALRCASPAAALNTRLLLLIGLPSHGGLRRRREAARASWMTHPLHGASVAACFLVSAHGPKPITSEMVAEHGRHGDLLFLDAPETPWLIRNRTRYSGFSKLGRGMPTFKQCAARSTRPPQPSPSPSPSPSPAPAPAPSPAPYPYP